MAMVARPHLGLLALLWAAAPALLAGCERPPPATEGVPPEARRRVSAWLAGDTPAGTPVAPRPRVDRGLRTLGAEVYRLRCVPCHGVNGNGRGPHAPRLATPPRDFTAGVYKLRSTPSGTLPTDEDLFRAVSRGLHGTAMIPWDWLPDGERWAVLEHVKGFSSRFAAEGPGEPLEVPAAPAATPELVALGAAAFARAGCPRCHGARGEGDGPSAPELRRDGGQPIRARPFSEGRFLRGGSLPDLWLTLATGLDGTPMPSYAALPAEDLWAISAWVASRRAGAPGADPDEALGVRIDVEGR